MLSETDLEYLANNCAGCRELQARIDAALSALVDARFYAGYRYGHDEAIRDAIARAEEALRPAAKQRFMNLTEGEQNGHLCSRVGLVG